MHRHTHAHTCRQVLARNFRLSNQWQISENLEITAGRSDRKASVKGKTSREDRGSGL